MLCEYQREHDMKINRQKYLFDELCFDFRPFFKQYKRKIFKEKWMCYYILYIII